MGTIRLVPDSAPSPPHDNLLGWTGIPSHFLDYPSSWPWNIEIILLPALCQKLGVPIPGTGCEEVLRLLVDLSDLILSAYETKPCCSCGRSTTRRGARRGRTTTKRARQFARSAPLSKNGGLGSYDSSAGRAELVAVSH
jgi:hypothetical protein